MRPQVVQRTSLYSTQRKQTCKGSALKGWILMPILPTIKKLNNTKRQDHLPTTIFHGQAVSFREGNQSTLR